MDNNPVSFIVYEAACTRLDHVIRRLTIALVLCIVLVFVSNAIWLYAWMQYDYSSETTSTETIYSQDGQGTNIIGDRNEVGHVAEKDNQNYREEENPHPEEFERD